MSQANPFEAPQTPLTIPGSEHATSDDERVRNEHLKHEASLQGVGSLWILGGFFTLLGGLGAIAAVFAGGDGAAIGVAIGIAGIYLALGGASLWTGWMLRKVNPKARIPATILAAFGLLGIPIGTLISAYILYLLHSQKGRLVLSDEYRAIIDRTPHIKYKMSWIVTAFALLLLFVLIAFVVVGIMAS